jgi:hypothetical protein
MLSRPALAAMSEALVHIVEQGRVEVIGQLSPKNS